MSLTLVVAVGEADASEAIQTAEAADVCRAHRDLADVGVGPVAGSAATVHRRAALKPGDAKEQWEIEGPHPGLHIRPQGIELTGEVLAEDGGVIDEVRVSPGMVMGPPHGFGWGGFYGFYHGMWASSYAIPPSVYTVRSVVVDTRLFDAKDFMVLWSGSSTTTPTSSMQTTIADFAKSLVAALADARAI